MNNLEAILKRPLANGYLHRGVKKRRWFLRREKR